MSGGWALELAMKACLLENVTEPSCVSIARQYGVLSACIGGRLCASTYRDASELVDRVGSIREVVREQGIGGGGKVRGLWVGQEIVEGVDDVLGLEGQDASQDWRRREGRFGSRAFFDLSDRQRSGKSAGGQGQGDDCRSELHDCYVGWSERMAGL